MKNIYQKLLFIGIIAVLAVSNSFGQTTIVEEDFDSNSTWSYTNDIPFFDNGTDGRYGVFPASTNSNLDNANFSGNVLFENDLDDEGDNGTTGFATVSFGNIDVSGYTSVEITFDYQFIDYNANNDEGKYQVFYDNTGQGEVFLADGSVSAEENTSGTVTLSVPPGTNSVSLDVAVRNNGASGYSAFDNFEITGVIASSDTQVNFDSASTSVNEDDGTVDLVLSILNEDAINSTSVEVALTSGNASDIDNYTTQTVTFPAGSTANETVTITITDNMIDEADKNLTFTLQNISGGNNAQIGSQNTFDLTIVDDDLAAPIALPYTEDFSNCATAEWITFDEAGTTNSWTCGGGEYQMNGFSGSGDDIDWLISDFRINFDDFSTVNIDVTTQERFGDAINQPGEFRLAYSTDYDGLGDPTTGTWTDLTFDPNNTSTGSTLSAASTVSVDASSVTGTAFVAFVYDQAQGAGSEDWRVQNVEITGVPNTSNDSNSDIAITAFDPTDNIDYSSFTATSGLTDANAIQIGEFEIRDGGATNNDTDSQSTTLTEVTIDITNFDNLAAIALFDGTSNVAEITSVTGSNDFTGLSLSAADDANKTFSLYATFNTSVVDNEQLQANVTSATADVAGSLFSAVDAGGATTPSTGNDNRIEVTATDLVFNQQPSDVGVNSVMSPAPTVEALDSNLNIDLDFTSAVSLVANSGSFAGSATSSENAVSGVSTFSNLVFDATATGVTLTASSGALNTDTSSAFDVIVAPIVIAQEDFDGSSPSWSNDIADQTFVDPTTSDEGLFIQASSNIGSGNTAFGRDTQGETGEPTLGSTFTFTFEDIAVSNFSNITLEFDYYVLANAEEGSYQLIIDGVAQPAVEFYNDPDTTPAQGTISENIGTASTVGLVITGSLNGGSDIMEYDNFRIEGDYDGDLIYASGAWTPSAPSGSTSADDVLVQNGTYSTSGDISVNSITVLSDATVNINSTDVLTVGSSINNNGNIIFNSDAAGTAQLADATGITVRGDITTERFIPAGDNNRRVFRFLSSSVSTTTSIRDNWQEGATSNTDNPASGFGTHITGSTTDGMNGFDGTTSGQSSLLVFDNVTQTWSSIDNTDVNTLETGNAYNLFVRGDRSIVLSNASQTPTNTTLRATGSVDIGSVDLSADLAAGDAEWSLVGNPYQAIVDFNSLTFTGDINSNNLYIWNANASTEGAYEVIDNATPAQQLIQPGQSFFVQNSNTVNTAPGLEFTEAAKNTSGMVTSVFDVSQIAIADLELYNTDNIKLDVIKFRFEAGANNGIDDFDGGKLLNPTENLAAVNSNTLLALERRDIPQEDEIIPLSVNQYQFNQYEFRLNTSNWDDAIKVYVVDSYLNTQTLIDENNIYSFSVDSNIPESISTDRFSLMFDNTTLGINDNSFGKSFSLYPNPTNDGLFSIKTQNLNTGDIEIRIHNLMGQQVMKQNYKAESNREININASDLSSGVYMVEFSQNNQNFTTKLIIQ